MGCTTTSFNNYKLLELYILQGSLYSKVVQVRTSAARGEHEENFTHFVTPLRLCVDEECMQTKHEISLAEDEQHMMVGMEIKKKVLMKNK